MIHPAILILWLYGLSVLAVGLWAGMRGLHYPALVVVLLWLLGIAEQLLAGMDETGRFALPVWGYLLADTMAAAWFIHCRERWPVLFGLTFAVQVGLHSARIMGWVSDPLTYWYMHSVTAFAQLGALGWWAAIVDRSPEGGDSTQIEAPS